MKRLFFSAIIFFFLAVPAQARDYVFSVDARLSRARDQVHKNYVDSVGEVAGLKISARSVVVMDAKTGKIILSKNSDLKTPIASVTKLMSLIIFIESQTDLNKIVWAEPGDLDELAKYIKEGDLVSRLNIKPGDKMKLKDVVYAGLVKSANNAVNMFVRSTDLTQDEFVRRMNERASVLRLFDTYFTEPTGLDQHNFSTALDMANLARYAFQNGFIKRVTTTKNYTFHTLNTGKAESSQNTNQLLSMFPSGYYAIVGGKTGFIEESRYNLVTQVRNWEGKEIIVALFGAETDEKRFIEAKNLIIEGFRRIK